MLKDPVKDAHKHYNHLHKRGWNKGVITSYLKGKVKGQFPLLRLENVSSKVLHNINLEIYPGEIFGLVGLGDSGKTSLLHAIIGYAPCNGRFLLRDDKSGDLVPAATSRMLAKTLIGFSPQYNSFYPEFSVQENLVHFAQLYGYGHETAITIADKLMKKLSLEHHTHTTAADLSPGLKKQLDIACALVHDPQLVLLDEPAADLDTVSQQRLWSLLVELRKKGTAIVISSHHTSDLEQLCDRFGILHKGKLLKTGKFQDIAGPFLHIYEVFIKTKKHNYDLLGQAFENLGYAIRRLDRGLIIYTNQPEKTLEEAGTLVQHHKDELLDIRLFKPGIKQFIQSLADHE